MGRYDMTDTWLRAIMAVGSKPLLLKFLCAQTLRQRSRTT